MRSSLPCLITAIVLAARPALAAGVHDLVGAEPHAQTVLTNAFLHLSSQGRTDGISFADATALVERDSLLADVVGAYREVKGSGKKQRRFTIRPVARHAYVYVNSKDQEREIHELYRGQGPDGQTAEIVYYASGGSFFGRFHSLVHVSLAAATPSEVAYDVNVYAYPEARVTRFVTKRLWLVRRYFQNKTDSLVDLTIRVTKVLCAS
jgi:hypothetical protein